MEYTKKKHNCQTRRDFILLLQLSKLKKNMINLRSSIESIEIRFTCTTIIQEAGLSPDLQIISQLSIRGERKLLIPFQPSNDRSQINFFGKSQVLFNELKISFFWTIWIIQYLLVKITRNINLNNMKEHQKNYFFPFESPQAADFNNILFLDVTHCHLVQEVSGLLKQKYLVPYQNNQKTVTGVLFGAHARPIICLPVQPLGKNAKPISVHFLVDTGAPTSFISKQAILAIFDVPELALIESPGVNIWGIKIAVNPSTAYWQGINLLGANYLRKAQLAFQCIYDQDPELEYCKLEKRG